MTADRTFLFSSRDGQKITVPEKAALLCTVVQDMVKNLELTEDAEVKVTNASIDILKKVVDWLKHHQDDHSVNIIDPEDRDATNVPEWDKNFLNVSQLALYEIILVANFLDVKGLMEYCCKMIAHTLKGKTPEALRTSFNVPPDFAPGEEEQIRRENAWCVD